MQLDKLHSSLTEIWSSFIQPWKLSCDFCLYYLILFIYFWFSDSPLFLSFFVLFRVFFFFFETGSDYLDLAGLELAL